MVKKRFPRKYLRVSSSDESDSDEFYQEEPATEAEPKKYSLRQRRGANFAEDFDYDILEENDDKIAPATETLLPDDKDFELKEAQKQESKTNTACGSQSVPKIIPNKSQTVTPNCTITKYKGRDMEPEIPQDKQSSDDMIDFEDVIRADILVNKSRIDYDSIIEKTEIKIDKRHPGGNEIKDIIENNESSPKLKKNGELAKKRGRKPKKAMESIDDSNVERKNKKLKFTEDTYQSYTHETTGLPINTVLGVTESLYELAERYHLQGGIMEGEMEPLPIEPILDESISTESKNNLHDDEISFKQSETASGAIEIF